MRKIGCLLIIIALAWFVSCSDNSTGTDGLGDNDPSETTIEIQGLVSGPLSDPGKPLLSDSSSTEYNSGVSNISTADLFTSKMATSIAETSVSGESPMPGVVVSIYELSDYISNQESASLLATTTTDSEGQYSVSEIEEGIDIVIVTDSNPRQSLLIINSEQDSSGDLNSATSIVSEYWAAEISNGTTLNQSEFDELLQTAGDLLENMPTDELQSLLEELVPENFGDGFPGSLSSKAQRFIVTLTGIDFAVCEDIEFSTESARPGTIINLQNLPANLGEDPFAWSYTDEEEEKFPVYVGALEDDEWELLVPMHPENHMDGGNVKIFIESEDTQVRCGDYEFEIEPLEPAPGTFKSMVDEFESTAISITEMIGYSREELLSKNMNELDSYAAVMKSVLTLIGGPEYPGSLQYTLDNHSSKETLDIYDAVLSELIKSDVTGKNINSGDSENPFFPEIISCEVTLNAVASGASFVKPEDLDCWMNVNRVFEDFNENEFQTYQDITRRGTSILSTIFFPQDPEKILLSDVESYLEFMEMMLASFEFLFPSELLGIDLEGDPLLYNNEDDETNGAWEASIYAEPKDWEFDILLSIGVLPVPGAGDAAGMISKLSRQSDVFQEIIAIYYDNLQGEIQSTGIGEYTFEAQVFGPIAIKTQRDEDYFTWELNTKSQETNTDPFSFTQDERGYTPEAVGTADLRVETKGGDVFKGQKVFNILELEVEPINIAIGTWIGENIFTGNESPYYINEQEDLALYADVSNAINKEVIWSVTPEESGLSVLDLTGRDNVVEVLATEPGSYIIEAESIADTGPRADKNPRRFDQVRIVVGGLNVSNPGCVEAGNTYQLTASIGGETVGFNELEWDINGPGSIDSDGVYSADGTGDVQINFRVIGQSEISHTINFAVKTFCSSFTISSPKFNFSGTCVGYEELPGTNRTAIYFDPQHEQPNGQIIIKEILSEVMSTTESWTEADPGWSINSFVQSGLEWPSKTWGYAPDDNIGAGGNFTLNHEVREYDETNVRVLGGSFSAEYRWEEVVGEEIIERLDPVTIDFTGALPPGEKYTNHQCLAIGGS
jgi:hypothetical protein